MIWLTFGSVLLFLLLFLARNLGPRRNAHRLAPGMVLVALAGVGAFAASLLVAVPAGHTGVAVLFGRVQDVMLDEGLNVKNPFAQVEMLSVRTETYTMSAITSEGKLRRDDAITALSSDGLRMPLDVTVAYRLVPEDAAWVYRNLGRDFEDKLVRPATRTVVREATSKFTSQEAYASEREALALEMQHLLTARIATILDQYEGWEGRGFIIQQVMLRNVDLPPKVKEAIEEKLAAEQEALRMRFVLEKEGQEAERKRIEAQGIADFQRIVSEGISEPLLRWKGIEATMEVARSDNAKVVIVGGGDDGLPVILNTGD